MDNPQSIASGRWAGAPAAGPDGLLLLQLIAALLQIAYCEDQVECRRVMLLAHFGERDFAREQVSAVMQALLPAGCSYLQPSAVLASSDLRC
jgi:hypothetical protein